MAGNLTSQGNSDRLWRPPTCRIPSRSTNGSSLEDKWFFAIQGDSDAPVMGAVNTGAVSKESHQSKLEKSETDCVPYACANINYFISFLQRNDNTTEKRKHEEDGDDEDTEMLARCGVTKYNRCHKKKRIMNSSSQSSLPWSMFLALMTVTNATNAVVYVYWTTELTMVMEMNRRNTADFVICRSYEEKSSVQMIGFFLTPHPPPPTPHAIQSNVSTDSGKQSMLQTLITDATDTEW